MLHRIIILSLGLMTLAMCNSQQKKNEHTSSKEVVTSTKTENNSATANSSSNTNTTASTTSSVGTKTASTSASSTKATASDNQTKTETSSPKSTSGTIYLKEGQNIFLKDQKMNVTFKKITEDSRCPKDVNCIWEGVASAEIELMGVATRPRTFTISTQENASRGFHQTIVFDGVAVILAEVSPYPTQSQNQKTMQGNYKIGLIFKKATEEDNKTFGSDTTTK